MHELSSKDAARGFSDTLSRVRFGNERIVLTRRGKPVAALVPLADLAQLEQRVEAVQTSGIDSDNPLKTDRP